MKFIIAVLVAIFIAFTSGEFIDIDNRLEEDKLNLDSSPELSLPLAISSNEDTNTTDGNCYNSLSQHTPSHTCQLIAVTFGWAISNFTLCSVRNARPIHLCETCVKQYLQVREAHNKFEATIDEEGNICRDYFVNLDRLEIVSEAYKYVHHLWRKASCKSCFQKTNNGTMIDKPTEETIKFSYMYNQTMACFNNHTGESHNLTCIDCLEDYQGLTESYVDIEDSYGDNICMDIVDTMNITRFLWSNEYGCLKRRGVSISLKICVGLMALLPITFYLVAYLLASKQESPILQQKRLAEIFAVNSNSDNLGDANGVPRMPVPVGRFGGGTPSLLRHR